MHSANCVCTQRESKDCTGTIHVLVLLLLWYYCGILSRKNDHILTCYHSGKLTIGFPQRWTCTMAFLDLILCLCFKVEYIFRSLWMLEVSPVSSGVPAQPTFSSTTEDSLFRKEARRSKGHSARGSLSLPKTWRSPSVPNTSCTALSTQEILHSPLILDSSA